MSEVQSFLDFIARSSSAFHATAAEEAILLKNGFQKLGAFDTWSLTPGGRYYVTRNGSTLVAFTLPKRKDFDHFQLVCSHSDSPDFVVKDSPEDTSAKLTRLNVEGYGGMILSSWLDKPLGIAGRIFVRRADGSLRSVLVDFERDMCLIPNMCIHLMHEVNDGYKYNRQTDMMPLYGTEGAESLKDLLAKEYCEDGETVVSTELHLYNRTPGSIFGNNSFFSCPRIDNLECAYTSLNAFLRDAPDGQVNVCAVFDNEEVGSGTKQGANSDFLRNVLETLCELSGKDPRQTRAAIASSVMVSADNAHAVHPNHPERYDANNRVYMNGGVVVKRAANQKYTTDAISESMFLEICRRAGVPAQVFHNRSDVPGGSTLGNLANTHAGMFTVDIGLAQLSMHSSYETAGTQDLGYMIRALSAFYATSIHASEDGVRFE